MNEADLTYDLSLLDQSAAAWQRSKGLRLVYQSLYEEVAQHCKGAQILELGAGIGVSRNFIPHVTTTDLLKTKYVDRSMSAYAIEAPEAGDAWTSVFAIDLLHHLREPMLFLKSASARLESGGRIVLIEPAATAFGVLFYKCFHHEPIVLGEVQAPYVFEPNGPNAEFANMAMGVGLMEKNRADITEILHGYGLSVQAIAYRDLLAYPLSGGYSKPQILPTAILQTVLLLESSLPQFIMRRLGLRMKLVFEKQ